MTVITPPDVPVNHIRQREWYRRFWSLAVNIEEAETVEQACVQVFLLLDSIQTFGSQTAAVIARQSLEQVMRDREAGACVG